MPFTKTKQIVLFAAFLLSTTACPAQPVTAADGQKNINQQSITPFQQMLVYVYQQNPQLVAEREALQIDDEHASQAFAGFRPNLTATGQVGREREAIAGNDWFYGPDASDALVAVQPVFNGFGTLAQFKAAKARVQAGRARLLATEQRVLFSAIGAWLDLCEKQKILAYSLDNLSRMYKYQEGTQTRFKAGDGTRTDLAQSESRLAEAEGRYASAQGAWENAQAAYRRIVGVRPPVTAFPPFLRELPRRVDEVEALARDHPELVQTYEEENAAKHDIDAASASLWPSVFLRGEISQSRSPELGLEKLRDDSITLNVSIPLYQGGGEYSRIREAKIARERSREAEVDTLRSVIERAQESWYNYYASCQLITTSRDASEAAGRALWGVQQEQSQGLRTTIDVLNAEAEFLNTQVSEVQAEKNARLEGYRLLASIGQLTAQGLHLPTATYDPKVHYEDTAKRSIGF